MNPHYEYREDNAAQDEDRQRRKLCFLHEPRAVHSLSLKSIDKPGFPDIPHDFHILLVGGVMVGHTSDGIKQSFVSPSGVKALLYKREFLLRLPGREMMS